MGRARNSFSTMVGHAEETMSDDKVTLPEKDLWVAVLCRAVLDACKGPPMLNMDLKCNRSHKNIYTYDRDQARHFFIEGGSHFRLICEMAGRNPDYVQNRIRKILLRQSGWNVDVPITSHYRQGPKRARKKYRKTFTSGPYYSTRGRKKPRRGLYVV
tara:strand:- start:331 stop:801 length:471 start_codon:yes stop_codon:yes gene_type:complete